MLMYTFGKKSSLLIPKVPIRSNFLPKTTVKVED